MKNIIGTKIGMTRIFDEKGIVIPVTVVKIDNCVVVGKKTKMKDSYSALIVAYSQLKLKSVNKPYLGQFKNVNLKLDSAVPRFITEFRLDSEFDSLNMDAGQLLTADIFQIGDYVDITGVSKGKGYSGVMKRHGFSGLSASHGNGEYRRAAGSIGASSDPSRVFKNKRMAGRFGGGNVTLQKLEVVKVYPEENLLLIKGCVPGIRGAYLRIKETSKCKKKRQ